MEPFGRYVDDDQRHALAQTMARNGYSVSTSEHGGWGGGTEWTFSRWRTRRYNLVGRLIPVLIILAGIATGERLLLAAAAALAVPLFAWYGLPAFTASLMWWDGEDEWDVRGYAGSDKEAEAVVALVEDVSGRKVKFRGP